MNPGKIAGILVRLGVIITLFLAYSFLFDFLFSGYGWGEHVLKRIDKIVLKLSGPADMFLASEESATATGTPSNPPPPPPPDPQPCTSAQVK